MSRALRPGVLLDRDGTLVDVVRDEETGVVSVAFHPRHLRLLPGVIEGLRAQRDAGWALGIATNQPGAAKGEVSVAAIEATHRALLAMLRDHGIVIDALAVCLHHPEGGPGGDPSLVRRCDCRKPAPGLLRDLLRDLAMDPARAWMIGDAPSDLAAAQAAKIRAAWIVPGRRCELCPLRGADSPVADVIAGRFDEAVAAILQVDRGA